MVGQFSASGGGRTGRRHATTSRSSASGRAPRPQHVTRDRELAAEAHRTLHTLRTASVRPALNSLWTGTTSDEHGLIDATTKRVEDARAAHARDIRAIFATESLTVAALGWLIACRSGTCSRASWPGAPKRFSAGDRVAVSLGYAAAMLILQSGRAPGR